MSLTSVEDLNLTPLEIVKELDKYIIGQFEAKKAVAIALQNRIRRSKVDQPLRDEITPKNILMIGPTGVGKTEIARRLAKLANAPFIKVEATKFTEVGYVGKDVESIIRDLVEITIKKYRLKEKKKLHSKAQIIAKEQILDILLPLNEDESEHASDTREKLKAMLENGSLDKKEIDIEVTSKKSKVELSGMHPNIEEISGQLQSFLDMTAEQKKIPKRVTISEAYKIFSDDEAENLVNEEDIRIATISSIEENGIVFIDEIDKVIAKGSSSHDVSRSGVQRDLLPLVEGTSVSTKYGIVRTEHILFIASGAFHIAKPSDLLAELQGRFPIRVELQPLTIRDFEQILTDTEANLLIQYTALLATDNIKLKFNEDAIKHIAEIAFKVNESTDNIGARRLYTVLEKLLEDILFDAGKVKKITINLDYVKNKLDKIVESKDLSHYIL